ERAGTASEPFEVLGVEPRVPDLVVADANEAPPELARRLGKREQRPAHELRRLQLVMEEGVDELRALPRVAQRARARRLGRARHDRELGRTARPGDAERASLGPLERR